MRPGVEPPLLSQDAEVRRLAAVRRYDILDTPPDAGFDRIAAMAARWFDVPMATVAFVDADRIWFKAAHGLDGLIQVGRDPGLCASAILADETYVVTDAGADPRSRESPLVAGELGVRFYAAAPIVTADGHRLGAVDVMDTRPRQVGVAAMATLRDLAALVMDQLELRLTALEVLRAERALRADVEQFASTLQRTLLPPALPRVPGLELACHYHAASPRDVGGDFYDVFPLTGGRWGFFLGDVCGKGAPAAALTSLVRYTLRAAASHDPDPVAVLTALNTVMLTEPEDRFCTTVFGLLEPEPESGDPDARAGDRAHDGAPPGFRVTLGTGGHPPAFALRTGGRIEPVAAEGMLVGVTPHADFAATHTRLGPGDTLLLYTDGLTEARPGGGDWFGEQGVTEFLAARTGTGAAALVADLAALLAGFVPAPDDDVAILALAVPTHGADLPNTTDQQTSAAQTQRSPG